MSHGITPIDPLSQNSNETGGQGFVSITIIILIIAIVGLAGYLTITNKLLQPTPMPVACTQEAKQCSDGSYVSRSGPNCEFAACPKPNEE